MKTRFVLFFLLASSMAAPAVNIALTSNQSEIKVNESITFHLEVTDTGRLSGSFSVFRREGMKYFLVKGPSYKADCSLCKGTSALGDIIQDPTYIFLEEGNYSAVANYGGESKAVNFSVVSGHPPASFMATSSTSTRPATASSSTSTSFTSSSSSSSTTASVSSTFPLTSTTLKEEKAEAEEMPVPGNGDVVPAAVLLLIVLSAAFLCLNKKRK